MLWGIDSEAGSRVCEHVFTHIITKRLYLSDLSLNLGPPLNNLLTEPLRFNGEIVPKWWRWPLIDSIYMVCTNCLVICTYQCALPHSVWRTVGVTCSIEECSGVLLKNVVVFYWRMLWCSIEECCDVLMKNVVMFYWRMFWCSIEECSGVLLKNVLMLYWRILWRSIVLK